jgi:hypothetical protein
MVTEAMQVPRQQKGVKNTAFAPIFGALQKKLHQIEQVLLRTRTRLIRIKLGETHSPSLVPCAEDVLRDRHQNVDRAAFQ